MSDRFRYTDEQWARIEEQLPENYTRPKYGPGVRSFITNASSRYKEGVETGVVTWMKDHENELRGLADQARALVDAYPSSFYYLHFAEDGQREKLIEDLSKLAEQADLHADQVSTEMQGSKTKLYLRNEFVQKLIQIYVSTGGELTDTIGGRFTRFLRAATDPVLDKKLTDPAARELFRKYKRATVK